MSLLEIDPSLPQLIVGLGNPGSEYDQTRHNCGFMVLDRLQEGFKGLPQFNAFRYDNGSFLCVGRNVSACAPGQPVLLQKPQTYMNLSGREVQRVMNYYKIPLSNILVIHDDIDLSLGDIRLKYGGGSGGHNGLKNITQHIGASYWRLRIGISHPTTHVSHYVLSRFSKEEKKQIDHVIDKIITSFYLWFDKKPEAFIKLLQTKL